MIIERVDGEERTVRVVLGETELAFIANALNEVCNGVEIEDFEFSTRLGVDRSEARALLAQVGLTLKALSGRP
jgi:hypothetical protein